MKTLDLAFESTYNFFFFVQIFCSKTRYFWALVDVITDVRFEVARNVS
jgi:hypothetical protein